MNRNLVRLAVTSLLCTLLIWNQANAEVQCENISSLKAHSGNYARKEFWEYLPVSKNWSKAVNKSFNKGISDIYVDEEGIVTLLLSWWEGANSDCVQFHGNELWVGTDGPFIYVGPTSRNSEDIYSERIFDNRCYRSNRGEKWCLLAGSITINSKVHKTRLVLPAEHGVPGTPAYGTPIHAYEDEALWMFVPTKNGWKVFKDTFEDDPNHKKINPDKDTPWQVLYP